MSAIDGLVAELCPDEVEYKRLSEMGKFVRGKRFVWKDVVPDGKPCIHYSELYTTYGLATKKTVSHLDEGKYEKLRFANPGDVVIVGAGETVEDIGIGVAWLGTEPAAVHDACYIYKHGDTLDPVFISYYLRSGFYHNQITRFVSSAKISSISADNLGRALIPVPPIEVQREVVRILDTFTELTDDLAAELTAEIEARRAQYEYYRDHLLLQESLESLDGKPVEMVRLGDVSRVLRGKRLTKKQLQEDGKFPVFHGGLSPIGFFSEKNRDAKCVMVINVGASAGTVGYSDCDFWSSDGCYCLENSSRIAPRFLYAVLKSKEYEIRSKVRHAGIPTLDAKILECLEIPVPSLETQRKVVDILDRFDALTTSLTDGIPAEIEARRSQYEYYRDRLLDFPHKGSVAV